MKVASAREPARRIAVAGTLAAAILAVPACSSGGSDQGGTTSGAGKAPAGAAGAQQAESGPDLINLPADKICALVPLAALDGLAVDPPTRVVTEEGVNQVHCFLQNAQNQAVASFSLGFDNSGALADAREVAARDHRVVDLPELGKGAFYEVTTALGKPALARVAGVPRRHADLLIASLNADLDSGRLPDQQAAISWYRAVYDRL